MKKAKKRKHLKILVAIISVSLVMILITAYFSTSLLSSVIGFITVPAQSAVANISNKMFTQSDMSYLQLSQENEELEKVNSDLKRKESEYYELKRQNQQYKNMLGLKEQNPDYEFAAASVIGRDPLELFFGLTINQGSLDGISLYDPVITDKGLVGYISSVYPTYSKVTTILSPEANVSAVDQVSLDSGIINGDMESAKSKKAHMKYVSSQHSMSDGDIVVTSGMGGVYPDNLLIGEVDSIIKEENSMETIITVNPYEDVETVMNVFIITNFIGQSLIE